MKLPEHMPATSNRGGAPNCSGARGILAVHFTIEQRGSASVRSALGNLAPAGCCATVCVPVLGCHCVTESPFCP